MLIANLNETELEPHHSNLTGTSLESLLASLASAQLH